MKDVAQLAGVGTMTVSRFLNGTANVSKDTAERVDQAIRQLHYRPNHMARALRGQRSHSIGLILPYLYDPFFASCAHAVTAVAKEQGYTVLMTTSDEDPEMEASEAARMLQRYVEGLVVIPANQGKSRITHALLGSVPMVVFDRPMVDDGYDTVLVENMAGARRMVEHLIEHGHRRIVFMGLSKNLYTIHQRYLGYQQAMQDAGLRVESSFQCTTPEATRAVIAAHRAQTDPPTAYFTSNTLASTFVYSEAHKLGLRIPDHVALAGFDDFFLANTLSPPLTVVRQPDEEMGRAAARQLFKRITGNTAQPKGAKTVMPVSLILRQSCGCKHVGDKIAP